MRPADVSLPIWIGPREGWIGSTVARVELILIRHGQPEWVRDGLNVDDPPLTDLGRRQAAAMARALAEERVDRILVSPLVRARQTAEPLVDVLGIRPEVHDWMAELRNPIWDGTDHDVERIFHEARRRPAEQHWEGLPGGESFRAFHQRVVTGLLETLDACGVRPRFGNLPLWDVDHLEDSDSNPETGQRVALVAHAGTNSVILTHLLGVEPVPWEWERFVLHHSSISRTMPLRIGDGWSFGLLQLSTVAHLGLDEVTR